MPRKPDAPSREVSSHLNNAFAGKQRLMPFFNRSNNEDLIHAVQSAGVSNGRNGFKKGKSGEKLAESEEDLLEHRTDGTDAFDALYIGCEKFPFHDSFAIRVGRIINFLFLPSILPVALSIHQMINFVLHR